MSGDERRPACRVCPSGHTGPRHDAMSGDTRQELLPKGWCRTCEAEVVIDGRPISEDESEWSHLRIDVEVGMGHAPGCWGDCGKHGCPVPEPCQVQIECGPVVLDLGAPDV